MRHYAPLFPLVAAVIVMAACSGTETLAPGPSTVLSGGSTHGSDTTVSTGPQTPPPPPAPIVSSFNLSGIVNGHEAGADTMQTFPVPGATITLVKVATVDGDTLQPSITTATAVTDAQGAYRMENLAPAYYRIDVVAPAGSPYENATSGIGPARATELKVYVSLARRP